MGLWAWMGWVAILSYDPLFASINRAKKMTFVLVSLLCELVRSI